MILVFHVKIDPDWYLYSSDFDPDLGPMVTEFSFEPNDAYELVGDIQPVGAKEKYDELWEGEYTYFTKEAEFRQTIRVRDEELTKVAGSYGYQVCTDVTGQCIPFEEDFTFELASSDEQPGKEQSSVDAASPFGKRNRSPGNQ